jgi:alkylhydroperoxidase/carboxymuconolactone decarboxylase family protein YurZ
VSDVLREKARNLVDPDLWENAPGVAAVMSAKTLDEKYREAMAIALEYAAGEVSGCCDDCPVTLRAAAKRLREGDE